MIKSIPPAGKTMQEIIADLAPPITKALKKLMCPEAREIPVFSGPLERLGDHIAAGHA